MTMFPLRSDRISLDLTETGGHLSDVVFTIGAGRRVSPMHTAPWVGETLPADIPPIIQMLRGDFFCAPFADPDPLSGEQVLHGLTSNGTWTVEASGEGTLDAVLAGTVMGATVRKHLEARPGEAVVYQRHTLSGGSGRLPVGHHAMLRAEHQLRLSFAPWTGAFTPPIPVETPPAGQPLLEVGQSLTDLEHARREGGGTIDLTSYPTPDGTEAIWMLVADRSPRFSWTAATNADEGWVWFALKDPRVLPQTLVWMSNGGRNYPPWNGRHRRVIGLEEICSYFHLGQKASVADNPVSLSGSPTAVTLDPARPLVVSYMFGLAEVPSDFDRVTDIVSTSGGVNLVGPGGREVFAPCDPSFVAAEVH